MPVLPDSLPWPLSVSKNVTAGMKLERSELKAFLGENPVQITDLETLFAQVEGPHPEKLYPKYAIVSGKHPYQGIKKMYALLALEYDQCLVMDSEAKFVKYIK